MDQFKRRLGPQMRSNVLAFSAGLLLGSGIVMFYYQPTDFSTSPISYSSKKKILPETPSTLSHVPYVPSDPAMIPDPRLLKPRHLKIMEYGLPNPTQLQLKKNYISLIDNRLKEPIWVMEHLTKDSLSGDADRVRATFKQDQDVLPEFRATNNDYMKSGYSRGHMSPASNNKVSPEAMSESFLLNSNIVPQNLDNNMFYWSRMENWVRKLVWDRGFEQVHVLSGPLFLPSNRTFKSPDEPIPPPPPPPSASDSSINDQRVLQAPRVQEESAILLPPPTDVYTMPPISSSSTANLQSSNSTAQMVPGKDFHYMAYKLIGENRVAVPTHLFKAVMATLGEKRYFACFIVPNAPIAEHLPLKDFHVPKSVLEKYTGYLVFDQVDPSRVLDMCATKDVKGNLCDMGNAADFQWMIFEKQLSKSKTVNQLNRVMNEMQQYSKSRNIQLPSKLFSLYESRKQKVEVESKKTS